VGPDLHGIAQGPKSENLQDLAAEHPDEWIGLWIDGTVPEVEGIERMGMPAFGDQLTPDEIQAVVDYLLTLQ
jgi:mono/diheme cytochrome c family protein